MAYFGGIDQTGLEPEAGITPLTGYHRTMPQQLTSQQNKYLRSLAHRLKPLVLVGKNGLTGDILASVHAALEKHELIKVKFIDHKEKETKKQMIDTICNQTRCFRAGMIGHTAILYRQATKASLRKIKLPGGSPGPVLH